LLALFVPLWERWVGRHTDTLTDKPRAEGEKIPAIALHPFIICAVAQDISQLCLPWRLL